MLLLILYAVMVCITAIIIGFCDDDITLTLLALLWPVIIIVLILIVCSKFGIFVRNKYKSYK